MSNPPPPPPAPPPKIVQKNLLTSEKKHSDFKDELEHQIELENCIGEGSTIYQIFEPVSPVLQDGPTCGLVALSMGLKGLKTPAELLDNAKANNWTKNGEMFCCEWMAQLAINAGSSKTKVITGGLLAHVSCISEWLSLGGSILVPYDKTQDHSPGLRDGRSAHWALITGLIVLQPKMAADKKTFSFDCVPCDCSSKPVPSVDSAYTICNNRSKYGVAIVDQQLQIVPVNLNNFKCLDSSVDFFVAAYQGTSLHVKLWHFPTLAASNINLKETDPKREGELQLPPGGIVAGLSGKAVLIYPPS